jgi:hypothetical protein
LKILFGIFYFYFPSFLKKKGLKELFISTAKAYNKNIPSLKGISFKKSLQIYAQFTKSEVENYISDGGDIGILQKEFNKHAVILGQKIRTKLLINTYSRAVSFFELLYHFIDIDLKISEQGEVTVKQCYFSDYYNPQICEIISAIDTGVFEGLTGGCKIEFYQRITGGHNCCKAKIFLKDNV